MVGVLRGVFFGRAVGSLEGRTGTLELGEIDVVGSGAGSVSMGVWELSSGSATALEERAGRAEAAATGTALLFDMRVPTTKAPPTKDATTRMPPVMAAQRWVGVDVGRSALDMALCVACAVKISAMALASGSIS